MLLPTGLRKKTDSHTPSVNVDAPQPIPRRRTASSENAKPPTRGEDPTLGVEDDAHPLNVLAKLQRTPDRTDFLYLKRKDTGHLTPSNPYQLQVVRYDDRDSVQGYFTMSSFGVTYIQEGREPVFTSAENWKREYFLFHAILKLNVFRLYRKWKPLKVWRIGVNYGRMQKNSRLLQLELMYLNNVFQPALLEIRAMCMELKKLHLFNLEPGVLYSLHGLIEAQSGRQLQVENEITDF